MSKAATIYRITHQCFDTIDDIQEVVDISDMDNLIDDADVQNVIDLIPGGNPVICEVVDTNEDPFTVIKSQALTIEINTDNPISLDTFASGSDSRWAVHNYIGAKTLFKGFLVLDDLSVDFMPDPNVLVLTASDGLGLLKEIPLVDFAGVNPVGEYTLAEIIAMCLNKTGTLLGIKVAFNIKPAGYIDDIRIANTNNQHLFSRCYIDAKSFEDEIGTCIDCYEILQRLLGEEAYIFQRQGFWWIIRVDEIEQARGLYISTFTSTGVFTNNLGEKDFGKDVGKDYPFTIFFAKEATKVIPTRPVKSVKLTYPYEFPREIVENIDFERGDLLTDISATEKTYKIESWTSLFSNTSTDDAPTTDIYIKRNFVDGYENQRYVVIEASPGDFNFIMSNPIQVGVKDKASLGVERRMSADGGGSTGFRDSCVQLRLYGNDGTYWTMRGISTAAGFTFPLWVQCTSTFRTNQRYIVFEGDEDDDQTESISLYNGEIAEMPVAGYLRILLYQSAHFTTAATYIDKVSFDYKPYVNGSYQKYVSSSQTVTQDSSIINDYKAKREKTVYLSDSPRRLLKGSLLLPLLYVEVYNGVAEFFAATSHFQLPGYQLGLFRIGQRLNITTTTNNNVTARVTAVSYSVIGVVTLVTTDATFVNETDATTKIDQMTFELANEFYNAAVYPDGPPDATYIHPYSEIQVFDVWNQFMYDKRVFQAELQGLQLASEDSGSLANNAHLCHKYLLADVDYNTADRSFMLLTFNQNHRDGGWSGTFREVFNFTREKNYLNRTFKYNT